jgi:iron complex transport system ATP-binding protein
VSPLRLEGLAWGFDGRALVSDCELKVDSGESLVVVGGNGAGKSTLLRTVAGILPPVGGRVLADGVDIHGLRPVERARRVSLLTQLQPVDPESTVADLVRLGRTPYLDRFGRLSRADRAAVERALDACRLGDLRDRHIGRISGGERQRARLAMVLAQETPLLLLDEPLSHLDLSYRLGLFELLGRLRAERRVAVLMVAHSLEDARRFGESFLLLDRGRARLFDRAGFADLVEAIRESSGVPAEWVY